MVTIGTDLREVERIRELFPKRKGRLPSMPTVRRWMSVGVRGVKLESVVVGGSRFSTPEMVQEFIRKLSSGPEDGPVACAEPVKPRGPQSGDGPPPIPAAAIAPAPAPIAAPFFVRTSPAGAKP